MESNFEMILNGVLEKIANGYSIAKREWKADRRNMFKDGRFLAYYEVKEAIRNMQDSENAVDVLFEEIARRFAAAKEEWKADRRNPFKDGKFLGYFEILNMIPQC